MPASPSIASTERDASQKAGLIDSLVPAGPLRFEPYLRPVVWGGRALEQQLNKALPSSQPFGESWELSDHDAHLSVVAEGRLAGTTLRALMENHREAILGPAADRHQVFPWLIKFLDCRDWLSVQVHPDAATVKALRPGEGSKTEAWFVLHAEPGSRIYAGLKPDVTEPDLRSALDRGTVADLLHSFEPEVGDCIFLASGTVHAVGGGVLMAEIQETSDCTFRLFDWNRVDAQGKARELHLEESFASIHWEYGPVEPTKLRNGPRNKTWQQRLVRCPYFDLTYRHLSGPCPFSGGRMQTLLVLAGEGTWEDGRPVQPGQTWLLPAATSRTTLRPKSTMRLLMATLP